MAIYIVAHFFNCIFHGFPTAGVYTYITYYVITSLNDSPCELTLANPFVGVNGCMSRFIKAL